MKFVNDLIIFQFQYGAIGGCGGLTAGASGSEFQFQYGAIGGNYQRSFPETYAISIPVWCDWW
ncbi:hypothetical protein NC99_30440 [Sunxiuqinia dokdonensis]|uniref:Uncharacterized protein n=1 Tax=Sunxiuqinia dokdonensis TaxID=1409788 RepID=A0A0L8V6I4_9BACT|nr:hypothetical protein NC99_30440 [Sunxiuqinia dokdonensis]